MLKHAHSIWCATVIELYLIGCFDLHDCDADSAVVYRHVRGDGTTSWHPANVTGHACRAPGQNALHPVLVASMLFNVPCRAVLCYV